jgi:hypothetical protein
MLKVIKDIIPSFNFEIRIPASGTISYKVTDGPTVALICAISIL